MKKYYRIRIAEKVLAPAALEPVVLAEYLLELGLHDAAERGVLLESPDLVFSHMSQSSDRYMSTPTAATPFTRGSGINGTKENR